MQTHDNPANEAYRLYDQAGNAYYGNPYNTDYEQYGLEYLDRDPLDDDEINLVVILGYN